MRENEDLHSVKVSAQQRAGPVAPPHLGPAPLHPGTFPAGTGKSTRTHNWVWDVTIIVIHEGSTRPWRLSQRHKDTATVWGDLSSKNCGLNTAWPQILDCTPRLTLFYSWLFTWCVFFPGTDFWEVTWWKTPWCWERLRAGGEGDDRGWDGWMASLTRWTWVSASSGSWWWTGKPGVLRSMGS